MPSTTALRHQLRPSLRFAILLLLLHVMVAVAVCATAMPLSAKLALLLMIFLSLFYYLARDTLLLTRNSWCDVSFKQRNVSVVTRDTTSFSGRITDGTFVSSCFVILCVKPEGRRLPLARVIFPDAMRADAFRELCVYLKFS